MSSLSSRPNISIAFPVPGSHVFHETHVIQIQRIVWIHERPVETLAYKHRCLESLQYIPKHIIHIIKQIELIWFAISRR